MESEFCFSPDACETCSRDPPSGELSMQIGEDRVGCRRHNCGLVSGAHLAEVIKSYPGAWVLINPLKTGLSRK